jgi:outer membrane protein assembly factor BamB
MGVDFACLEIGGWSFGDRFDFRSSKRVFAMRRLSCPLFQAAGAAILACLVAGLGLADATETQHWPMFRGNSLGTGVATTALPDRLEQIWAFEVEKGSFESTAAVVNGVVYIGDLDGRFYALDLRTGKEIWRYTIEGGFPGSAAVRDGRVYIGDYDGRLHCLDVNGGKLIWSFEAQGEINASPNFHKQHVLFGSQDATLYCLDCVSGQLVWKHTIEDQIRCAPTIVESRAFLAGCDGKLHIINVDNGQEIGSVEIQAPTGVTPAVLGDRVYFGTEGGDLFCVDWRQAKAIWTFHDPSSDQSIRSSPAVTAEAVIFGSRSKQVYALHPESGQLMWKVPAGRGVDASPVVAGQRAFVPVTNGKLLALDVRSGKIDWEFEGRGGFTGSPAIADGCLIVASNEGVVYCFGKNREPEAANGH